MSLHYQIMYGSRGEQASIWLNAKYLASPPHHQLPLLKVLVLHVPVSDVTRTDLPLLWLDHAPPAMSCGLRFDVECAPCGRMNLEMVSGRW